MLTAGAAAAAMLVLWLSSIVLGDVSLVDIYWGPGFLLIAGIAAADAEVWTRRTALILALVAIWALRLAAHLFLRWRRLGVEDRRYAAMRRKAGSGFVVRSLISVFALQGAIMWVISVPLQLALRSPTASMGWCGWLGAAIFTLGWLWESVADAQLTAFRRNPAQAGRVLDTGLWAWSRHPNYFGEVVLWWGLFLVTVDGTRAWWTIFSPLIVTVLLLRISGIPILERGMRKRRPDYDDYAARTPAFIPLPFAAGRAKRSTPHRARSRR